MVSFLRHSGMVRQRQSRKLEIPGSMLAHRPGMTVSGLFHEPVSPSYNAGASAYE
jgi:hypothetical protein